MREGFAGRVARAFVDNPVVPILLLIAFALGGLALATVPREEEPQIRVPLVDVIVPAPELGAADAVERVVKPLEDILAGVEGVDHVYARAREGRVVVSARFFPGTDSDDAVLRVRERIGANASRAPPSVGEPVIIGRGIEDVAVLVVTLAPKPRAAARYDRARMHELAEALRWRMARIDRVGLTYVVGAGPGEIRIEPDPDALARWGVTPDRLLERVRAANAVVELSDLQGPAERHPVLGGRTAASPEEVANLLVATADDRPVYVRDLARVTLAAPEPGALVRHRSAEDARLLPAASLAVAKRPGANGVEVAAAARAVIEAARADLLPADVEAHVVRDYGESGSRNARALFVQLLSATGVIVLLIGLFVGLREALVVLVVIPATILLSFFALWTMGYTVNRVSLFALIFAIGILVDDAIVVVENITRRWQRGDGERLGHAEAAVRAVDEVGNPTVVSTLTIIAALLPMLAVSGLMGPYMAPIPANASAAVVFSTAVALVATPWMMLKLVGLRLSLGLMTGGGDGGPLGRAYRRMATPLLRTRPRALALLVTSALATLASFLLIAFTLVPVKLLPFDDKREMQVVVDLPETAAVEDTARVLDAAARRIAEVAEVESLQLYAGTAGPFTFNGLVRQYYLRESAELGDVKVNLVDADERERQSHAIAIEVRERLADLPAPEGTAVRVVETPPGPPVFATLLAEVYGPDVESRRAAAREVHAAFEAVPYVIDVDDTIGASTTRIRFEIDRAALEHYGVAEAEVTATLRTLLGREDALETTERLADGARAVVVVLDGADRVPEARLLSVPVAARGSTVALDQVVDMTAEPAARPRFRRNARPAIMVMGTLAGAREAPVYAMIDVAERLEATGSDLTLRLAGQPVAADRPTLLWHGEWEITLTTFRDLGAAFAVAVAVIYAVVVWRFGRLGLPLLVMAPVPLTLVGVLVGHWAVGAKFTATSMIGFIALAGIVVRNSILLVEFVEARRVEGLPVREAAIEAGAVRFRPIFLTAVTAMVGAAFIMTDPIFRGLAVSLFFGLASSTLLTVLVVPAVYVWRRG
jgi:multidrug efflux pump subunit AcrB